MRTPVKTAVPPCCRPNRVDPCMRTSSSGLWQERKQSVKAVKSRDAEAKARNERAGSLVATKAAQDMAQREAEREAEAARIEAEAAQKAKTVLSHEKDLFKAKRNEQKATKKATQEAHMRNEREFQERREGVKKRENETMATKARQAQLERESKAKIEQQFKARGQRAA